MRMTLRQLQIFAAVADTGSTTAAGARVALSQSATSGALNELENLLDSRLFDRIGKRLVLNDSGRALLPHARALLDGAHGIESRFGVGAGPYEAAGARFVTRLRVGASTTIGNYLLPSLIASHLANPMADAPPKGRAQGVAHEVTSDVTIDVDIGNTGDVAASVARLDVDVGFIEGPCHEPDLLARPWLEDEMVVVCSPSHPLVRAEPAARVGVKALRQQRWLLREPGSGTRETVEQALLPHLHQWLHPMQLGSSEAIKEAAALGMGLTCLSRFAVRDFVSLGRLVVVDSTLPRLSRRFYVVQHRQKQFSAGLERFVAHCTAA